MHFPPSKFLFLSFFFFFFSAWLGLVERRVMAAVGRQRSTAGIWNRMYTSSASPTTPTPLVRIDSIMPSKKKKIFIYTLFPLFPPNSLFPQRRICHFLLIRISIFPLSTTFFVLRQQRHLCVCYIATIHASSLGGIKIHGESSMSQG